MQIEVNNASIHYDIAGEENEQTMIVLHGGRGFGTHKGVFATFKPLADQYRVIGIDMRGHGQSSLTPPYTFDQIADDLEVIRQKLSDNRPMILEGGSFGGMIALHYAVRYPNSLSHLILRGTAPSWHHEIEAMQNLRERAARKAPMATESMLEKLFTPTIVNDHEFRLIMFSLYPMYAADGNPVDLDHILATATHTDYHAQVHNDLFANRDYDVIAHLPDIQVPTLVLCGDGDWICPPSQSRLIAERIPHAKLVMVPDCNHSVPDDIAVPETRKFLEEHKA